MPGNFEKVMETYGLLTDVQSRHSSLRLKVCSVLNQYNRGEIKELLRFVSDEMKVDDHSIVPVHGNPRDEGVRGESFKDFTEVARWLTPCETEIPADFGQWFSGGSGDGKGEHSTNPCRKPQWIPMSCRFQGCRDRRDRPGLPMRNLHGRSCWRPEEDGI